MTVPKVSQHVFAWYALAAFSSLSVGLAVALRFLEGGWALGAMLTALLGSLGTAYLSAGYAGQRWMLGAMAGLAGAGLAALLLGNWAWLLPGVVAVLALLPLLQKADNLPRVAEGDLWGWVFVFPAVFLLIVWHFAPALYALVLSFLDNFNFLKPPEFAGLENYAALLRDPVFWQSLLNSFWYVVGTVPLGIFIATLTAILLNEKVRGLTLFRTLYFLPYITALTAAAAVWKWIYNPDFGLLNALLGTNVAWLENPNGIFALLTGLELPQWASGPSVALCAIMVMSIWHHLGYSVVILLAGLQSIPPEYYEAASLDGASWWDKVRHITFPLLSATTFFLAITGLIGAFQVFTQILVLTPDGGQLKDTTTIVKYLYDKGFRDNNYSYASAMAFALFVIVFVMTLVQNRLLSKRVTYDI